MKKFILLFIFSYCISFAYSTNVKGAYAIGIFDKNGDGENIQHARETKNDYNGICYTKVFVLGDSLNIKPKVSIGNSIGHFQSSKSVFNDKKIKIGTLFIFKHYTVSKGYIKVSFENRVYDAKVFVK